MTEPTDALWQLLDERSSRRVLLQYCRGVDRFDLDLVRDCYWPEARVGERVGGRGGLWAYRVRVSRKGTNGARA